jgi:hypothetical protein
MSYILPLEVPQTDGVGGILTSNSALCWLNSKQTHPVPEGSLHNRSHGQIKPLED